MRPQLELAVFAMGTVATHLLPAVGHVTLGRSDENDVQIDESSVSRRHAVLHLDPALRIEDLGSANGTRVRRSGARAETTELLDVAVARGKPAELAVGEPVLLGSTLLVVRRRAGAEIEGEGAAGEAHVVHDPAMTRLYDLAARVAEGPISVLLLGETGVGKEVLAEAIHRRSPRAAGPFLRLNCAALSESLLESELFGHEKGAFTGAVRAKPGLLETADKGTVFLDEVGELPLSTQVKLLRVLEDRRVMRVGGLTARRIDVRFVAATNRDLAAEIQRGAFRQDLFFRLDGITLAIPPLRERTGEIAALARRFAAQAAGALGRETPGISAEALAALEAHAWPGNVRELRNVVERAVVLSSGGELLREHLLLPVVPSKAAAARAPLPSAEAARGANEAAERLRIIEALERCAGNQTHAAALIAMPRRTFVARLKAYGIPRPRTRS